MKWTRVCVSMLNHFSHFQLFASLWTIACQAFLSMGFPGQEYWSELPCPPPGGLPDPGIKPAPLRSLASADRFFTAPPPGKSELRCRSNQIWTVIGSVLGESYSFVSSQMLLGLGKWNLLPHASICIRWWKKWFWSFLCQDSKAAREKKTLMGQKYTQIRSPWVLQFCLSNGDFILTEKLENLLIVLCFVNSWWGQFIIFVNLYKYVHRYIIIKWNYIIYYEHPRGTCTLSCSTFKMVSILYRANNSSLISI